MNIELKDVPADYQQKIAIIHSLKTPLHMMSVNDICEQCGISRKKFYSLFHSKEAILIWYLDVCYALSHRRIGIDLSWEDGITLCAYLLWQERHFLRLNYPRQAKRHFETSWTMRARFLDALRTTLKAKGVEITTGLEAEMQVYAGAVIELIRVGTTATGYDNFNQAVDTWLSCIPRHLYEALALK